MQPELEPLLSPIGQPTNLETGKILRAPRWPFADRKHGCFLERRDSRSHILHRRRRDVEIEIDGVSPYPVVSDRMPSHHQARQTGVLKGRHDLGQTGLDTQWMESSHRRLPCARRSLTSSWRPNSSSVSRWASSAISARCASRTMLSASAVELARPDKRSASISASMALGEGAIFSSLRLVIVRVLSCAREGDIPNCSGKLHDPVKPALRRLGILPQQLRTSPLFVLTISYMNTDRHLTRPAANSLLPLGNGVAA